MQQATGRTVRLFLVDGSPTGILTAEIMNWTGHVLVAPRSRLAEALKREEAGRTGVYFLTGDDPEQPSRMRVYIGEGDSVAERLKNHSKDEAKDFWTRACIVTSKDANLTKSHVRYLESRLVEITKIAGRGNLANGNEPAPKTLPESDISDMEFFLAQIQVVLPVVGLDFLRPKPTKPIQLSEPPSNAPSPPVQKLELTLVSKRHGLDAEAVDADGEIVVRAGSRAILKGDFAMNQYGSLRQQLIDDGRLKLTSDDKFYEFVEDVPFRSPSAAAAVIFDRNSNGRTSWKLKGSGQTLKDWQDSQLAATPVVD